MKEILQPEGENAESQVFGKSEGFLFDEVPDELNNIRLQIAVSKIYKQLKSNI